jgi:ATP synthase protein I
MQSNDARIVRSAAIPTAVAGIAAVAVSASVAGVQGAVGAAVGVVLVLLFFGAGIITLQKSARAFPHLFQAMGLLVYTTQLLAMAVVLAAFKDTTLFDIRALAFSMLGTILVWVASQVVAHLRTKTPYVETESESEPEPEPAGKGPVAERRP